MKSELPVSDEDDIAPSQSIARSFLFIHISIVNAPPLRLFPTHTCAMMTSRARVVRLIIQQINYRSRSLRFFFMIFNIAMRLFVVVIHLFADLSLIAIYQNFELFEIL